MTPKDKNILNKIKNLEKKTKTEKKKKKRRKTRDGSTILDWVFELFFCLFADIRGEH